jgi:hypothetical protein
MAVQQPREDPGRVEQVTTTAYDAPTHPARAVGDVHNVDLDVLNRPEAQWPRQRAHWNAIWAGLLAAFTSFVVLSLLGLAVGVSVLSSNGTGVLPREGRGSVIWEMVAGIVAYFIGGCVAGRAAPVFKRSWGALNGVSVFFLSMPLAIFALLALGAIAAGVGAGVAVALGHAFHVTVPPLTSGPALGQERTVSWAALAWVLAGIIVSYLGGALGTRQRPQAPTS